MPTLNGKIMRSDSYTQICNDNNAKATNIQSEYIFKVGDKVYKRCPSPCHVVLTIAKCEGTSQDNSTVSLCEVYFIVFNFKALCVEPCNPKQENNKSFFHACVHVPTK